MELVHHYMIIPIHLLKEGLPTSPLLRNRYEWTGADGQEQ